MTAATVPPFRLNQFGGSLGGPVYLPGYKGKDKTFFFVNYEGQRRRRQTTTIATVPTVAQRNGDLSTLGGQIYDPMSGDPATGRRQPFPNNIIPPNRIDPISKALLKYWPEPNLPGNAANFNTTAAEKIDYDQVTTRIDHNFSSKDRIMGRYNLIDQPFFRAMYAPLAGQVSPVLSTGAVLQYTRILVSARSKRVSVRLFPFVCRATRRSP